MENNKNLAVSRKEFDKIYLRYKPKLLRYVYTMIENRDMAEDIVQETFYEAVRKYDVFSTHPNQMGWLYQTARYKIKECVRKVKPHAEVRFEPTQLEPSDEEEGYCKAEMEMVIKDTLTAEEMLRFRRYFLWGESIAEIAERENVSENNMRVKVTRLKKKIESALKDKE
ncbi:MAG: RNA polymerase sigma factor [Lachnospiraceae bacterium]|nr:RNA polymerase sigma factor [Lachnospiraceae bacterium]